MALYTQQIETRTNLEPFHSTIPLACGRNRELWEQPFQACAIDADYMKPDGQNSVISFVMSKWLLPELSIPAAGQKDRRLWGREWMITLLVLAWVEAACLLACLLTCLLACSVGRGCITGLITVLQFYYNSNNE